VVELNTDVPSVPVGARVPVIRFPEPDPTAQNCVVDVSATHDTP
jgi:hypothetical protein